MPELRRSQRFGNLRRLDRSERSGLMMDTLKVLGVGLITAFTMGPILSFGEMTEEIATKIGMSTLNLSFWSSLLLGLFFASGFLAFALVAAFDSMTWSHNNPERYVNMLGAACYITGYMASAFIGTNQSAFIGVWFTFVGIGSGLLYWTTFAIASSWFEGSDKMKVIGYAAITPSLYVGIFPFVYSGMVGMSYAIDPWSVVFVTLASVGALMMALSWVFVKTNRPSSAGKDNEDPFANQWAGLTFAFMMLGAFLFQAQFYIPYIRLPPYVIEVLGGSEAAQSATTALFGWGSLVGRVFAALFATPTAFRGHVLSMQLVVFSGAMGLFYMLWGLQNGLAYVQAFAFMYGATSGACYVDIMMMLHSYWVRAFKPMNDERQLMFKLGVYGACLSVGQIVSAFVFYYGVPSYTNTIIYAGSVAAGACIFFFIVALFAFTPR